MHAYPASARNHARFAVTCAGAVLATLAVACSSNANSTFVGPPALLTAASSDGMNGTVGTDIGPFVVKVTDTAGTLLPNVVVHFTASNGLTLAAATGTTDASGTTHTSGTFGYVAGPYTVTATVAGISAPLVIHVTANADVATAFSVFAGNNQTAAGTTQLGEALAASITDRYGNGIAGITVTWTAVSGIIGTPSTHTASNGVAQTTYTLPKGAGPSLVTATAIVNSTNMTVTFTENGT
jgi:adhesin/invasin